ncbi:hypothetical protein A1Q1_03497 [Trichosporon asahii var. asahii CBS 2479]|uniref:Uncharacterized protein n=1 Tax=Trichosporon asahii var. asahii (strain ATCC 90039 / CBS 2479 / JCM 2466 / KCTC 7840 / NBRC 103889/ NCYC 2677 / UAMH 7654) TaxID=1186058 RepID=J6EXQ0_TRIAS|nr:hypothetical protein A1Q1_03497 [Trichosporon asahii var. asahii CBS 2479]EJT47602.1 hypothetical protein A1Q1_03497 [Trichosporon asahii var. asahii CBS 2479]
MGFLRRHRSLFFPTSNEAAAGGSGMAAHSSGAAASLDVPPSPNETKLRRRKSFFEVLGFGKKRASKRQSMSAAVSSKAGQRPRSATVGDYQQQKNKSDIPPVPPLPPLHKKVGNVAAVQLDDLELDDDHMAAITAVVNNSSRDEPPEHLFLNVPGSNEPGSRLSVASNASKRASTISTRSTNSVNQPQQQPRSASDSTPNGRQSRRSSLRNSLLVVKDLPELPSGPSGRPITPTRARAAPPSSYAPPPESIAQRLEAANVTPEPSLSAPSTPAQSAPSTPTRPRADLGAEAPMPVSEVTKTALAVQPAAVEPAEQHVEKPIEIEEPVSLQPIAAEEPAPEPIEAQPPAEVTSPTAPIVDTNAPAAEELTPALDTPEPAPATEPSPAAPESEIDPNDVPEIPDEPVVAKVDVPAAPEQSASDDTVEVVQPSLAPSSTETPSTPPRSPVAPVASEVSKSDAPVVQTPDEEVPGQSWSSSSHPSTPSMLPHTPVGDETKPTIAGDESPLLTPQRTGSPVVKQRQVSAPLAPVTPLIKEPDHPSVPTEKKEKYATPGAPGASIGKGAPPVSQRFSQLRSVSLPTPAQGQRRLSAPSSPGKSDDPSLDDFVGLMKQVISREKGMSIRDAARAAEQRKSSVPV